VILITQQHCSRHGVQIRVYLFLIESSLNFVIHFMYPVLLFPTHYFVLYSAVAQFVTLCFDGSCFCYQNVHTIDLEIIYWSVYFVTFTIESTQYHCLSNDFSYLQVTAFECRTR